MPVLKRYTGTEWQVVGAPVSSPASSTLAYAITTASVTGIGSTLTPLTELTVTVTVPAGRRLKITGRVWATNTTADGRILLAVQEDGVEVGYGGISPATANVAEGLYVETVITPTSGSHTYRLAMAASAGTAAHAQSSVHPGFILVEDITGTVWPAGQAITVGMVASEAWTAYTPSLIQSNTISATNTNSRYQKIGRIVTGQFRLQSTGAGTASAAVVVTLPVPAATLGAVVGSVWFYDDNTATRYAMVMEVHASNASQAYFLHDTSGGNAFGTVPGITVASGDQVRGVFTYEAAS